MVLGKHISFLLDTGASRSVLTDYVGPLKKASFPIVGIGSSNTSTGFTVQAGALWRATPARKLEPTATHRLRLDIGG
jgi:hypothetical protein